MTKFKKVILGFGVALALGVTCYSLSLIQPVKAQEDDVNLHIKLEASLDNGVTWKNYSGTEFSGGESVVADPGDTVLVRGKMWNTGTGDAYGAIAEGTLTNFGYVSAINLDDADVDGNGRSYTLGEGMENAQISQVSNTTIEECNPLNGSECADFNFVLENNFPVGETVIIAKMEIASYQTRVLNFLFDDLTREAYALGTGRDSAVRIVVNVAESVAEILPETGVNL